jgi:hypothetical protein
VLAIAMASRITSFSIAIWAAKKGGCSVISKALEDSVYNLTIRLISLVDTMIVMGLVGLRLPISFLNSSKACCSSLYKLAYLRK